MVVVSIRRIASVLLVTLLPATALVACSGSGGGPLSSAASSLATRSPSVSLPTAGTSKPAAPTRTSTPTSRPTATETPSETATQEPTTPTPTPTPTPTQTKTVTTTATATPTPTPTPTSTPTQTPTPTTTPSASTSQSAAESTSSTTSLWPWLLLALAAIIAVTVALMMAASRRRRDAWRTTVEEAFARGNLLADSLTSDLVAGDGSESPDQAARHDADLAAFLNQTSALPTAAPSDTVRPTAQRVADSARSTQASLTQLRVASVVDRPGAQQALGTQIGGLRAALDDLRATTVPKP